ncbi:hypothetical protein PsorP6_012365 [Peronosclerospora sorghi]|uniref:Uncharacterized protein n=1 Tax=Peronosclerospora sorghi TaxID=230839 RepID=A0ACC0WEG5_9STRA|nr:hypothetical protein PsorP6_012365 [Peronosclerospora sorghi]
MAFLHERPRLFRHCAMETASVHAATLRSLPLVAVDDTEEVLQSLFIRAYGSDLQRNVMSLPRQLQHHLALLFALLIRRHTYALA